MSKEYKEYPNTNYIVTSDGRMARLLKETRIYNQTYYNPIVFGKMKRVNKLNLINAYNTDFAKNDDIEKEG